MSTHDDTESLVTTDDEPLRLFMGYLSHDRSPRPEAFDFVTVWGTGDGEPDEDALAVIVVPAGSNFDVSVEALRDALPIEVPQENRATVARWAMHALVRAACGTTEAPPDRGRLTAAA